MDQRPTVSVIIPHFNDLSGLEICLSELARQTYPGDLTEVIVADNASPVGLRQVEAVVGGRAQVVLVEERGAGPARNGAVARSRGQVLAFIDSDCVPESEWLEEGVHALSQHDFIGGQVNVLVGNEANMSPVEAFERVFAFDFKSYIERKGFTGAGNLFCPRRVFDEVGGFRTGLSEDLEWSRRATALGYRLGYAPRAVVGHPARRTWSELTRKWRRVNTETFGLSEGMRGRRLRWLLRALLLPASAIAHTPRVLMSRKLNSLSQRIGALKILYALRLWRFQDALRMLKENDNASSAEMTASSEAGAANHR